MDSRNRSLEIRNMAIILNGTAQMYGHYGYGRYG